MVDDDDEQIVLRVGRALRVARWRKGVTLAGVAEVSRGEFRASVLGRLEPGERVPTVERLAELAAFYRVPVGSLVAPGRTARPVVIVDLTTTDFVAPHLVDAIVAMRAVP